MLEKFLLANGPVDVFCPCSNNNCINSEIVNILSNHTFSESNKGMMLGSLNSYFSNNSSKELFEKANIKMHPSWLTSCGASLIYTQALSSESITGWKESALNYVSRKFDTIFKLI